MTYPTHPSADAVELFDRELDAFVRGDARALRRLERLDPGMADAVTEVYALADLSGFAAAEPRWDQLADDTDATDVTSIGSQPGGRRVRRRAARTRTGGHRGDGPASQRSRTAFPAPSADATGGIERVGHWDGQVGIRRRVRSGVMAAVAVALLAAVVGAGAFIAVRGDDRGDGRPEMLAAVGASPTGEGTESTRELVELPAGTTLPLSVAEGDAFGMGGMAATSGGIYRLVATASFTGVEGVHADSGAVWWRLSTPWSGAGIVAGGFGVVVVTDPNRLVALDPSTGGDVWTFTFDRPVVSMALQDADLNDDVLYVWDESSTMTALDSGTGETIWRRTTGDPGGPQSSGDGHAMPGIRPAIGDEAIVMVAANGTLNAFDRASGEPLWSLPGFDGIETRIVINFGRLLALSETGAVGDPAGSLTATGIDLATGTVDWRLGVSGVLTQPAASEETFFYLIGDRVSTFPDGGEITPRYVDYDACCAAWTVPAEAPAGAVDGSDAGGAGGTHVFGIDTASGQVIWSRSTKAGNFVAAKTFFPQSGGLFAVTSDGQVIWIQRETGGILEPPVGFDGFVGQVLEITPLRSERVQYTVTFADGSLVLVHRSAAQG